MIDNIGRVLKNIEKISELKNDNLSFIVIADDVYGVKTEYTINFDNNFGINVRNNFTGVFLKDYIPNKENEFIFSIIYDTLKKMSNSNSKNFSENFIENLAKNITLPVDNNYYPLVKFSIEFENEKIFKYLMSSNGEKFRNLSREQKLILAKTACSVNNSELVHILEQEGFYFGAEATKTAFLNKNFNLFMYLVGKENPDLLLDNGKMLIYSVVNNYPIKAIRDFISSEGTEIQKEYSELITFINNGVFNEQKSFMENIINTPSNVDSLFYWTAVLDSPEEIRRGIRHLGRELLEKNLNKADSFGFTPFYFIVKKGNPELVSELLNRNDINIKLVDKEINEIREIFGNNEEIMNLLEKHTSKNTIENLLKEEKNKTQFDLLIDKNFNNRENIMDFLKTKLEKAEFDAIINNIGNQEKQKEPKKGK